MTKKPHQNVTQFQDELRNFIDKNGVARIAAETNVSFNQIKSFAYGAALPRLDTYFKLIDAMQCLSK